MQICLDYEEGWFLRINTRDKIRPCVPISVRENSFLEHDSHVDCSINVIDEFELDEALKRDGVIGRLSLDSAPAILAALLATSYISTRDKDRLSLIFSKNL